ncbi:MAG: T9SS C-terminal target domain-containing protein [Bacteroidetes bacterium]|nr:MAG: T9SS C-terminal target domain-containing protein [Bacteroidota bacterium]
MKQTLRLIPFLLLIALFAFQATAAPGPQPIVTKIKIYPNPATEFISIDNTQDVKELYILNLVGRKLKVIENVEQDVQYDISDLPNGMYLVQIISHKNKIITTQRLSKR